MTSINIEPINYLTGTEITSVKIGVGTFLNIYSKNVGTEESYQLWIYMSQWTILKHKVELLSSDKSNNIREFNFKDTFSHSVRYERVVSIDHEEIKLLFSNDLKMELWSDVDVFGQDSVMAHVYRNGKSIGSISAADA